jgi:hypothetical protein
LLVGVVQGAWDQIKVEISEEWEQVKTDFSAIFDGGLPVIDIPTPDISWPDIITPPDWLVDWFTMDLASYIKKYFGGGGGGGTDSSTVNLPPSSIGGDLPYTDVPPGTVLPEPPIPVPEATIESYQAMGDAFLTISDNATVAGPALDGVVQKMRELDESALGAGTAIGASFGAGIMEGVALMGSALGPAIDGIIQQMRALDVAALGAGTAVGASFGAGIAEGINLMSGAVTGAAQAMVAIMRAQDAPALGAGTATGASYGAGMANGINSMQGAVSGAASGLVATMRGFDGAALNAGLAIGMSFGAGIAEGINSMQGAVSSAAATLAGMVSGSAKKKLDVSSPSRVARDEIGAMFGLGVALGIEDMYSRVGMASTGMANRMVSAAQATPGQYVTPATYGGGGNAGAMVVNVTVEGNVTTERDLTANVTREIGSAIRDDFLRHRTAAGVR